jgi:tRNA A-37 threonylcarbamoyl transferase component Bud32
LHVSKHIVENEKNLFNLFKNIDSIFINDGITVHSDRNTTKKIKFKNRVFAVKAFQLPNMLQRLAYANFRKPKAQRSLEFSEKLIEAGLHSPKPIGYIVKIKRMQVHQSYYISEFHEFDHDLVPVFNDFNTHLELIDKFIKTVARMHDFNIYHHDLTKRNVLINQSEEQVFSFIDNNRISFDRMSLKMRMESISKLTNNIEELHTLAKLYSKYSIYNPDRCIHFIEKGFEKSQRYKKIKNFLKGNKKGAFDATPFSTRGNQR